MRGKLRFVVAAVALALAGGAFAPIDAAPLSEAPTWQPPVGSTPTGGTWLFLEGTNHFVFSGTRLLTLANAVITVGATADNPYFSVSEDTWWNGWFDEGTLSATVQPGYFPDAVRSPESGPGVDFSGDGRGCNTVKGWLAVDLVTYRGGELERLVLRFGHQCEGINGWLYGKLSYDVDDVPLPYVPKQPRPLWQPAPGSTPPTGDYLYFEGHNDYIGINQPWLYTETTPDVLSGGGDSGYFQADVFRREGAGGANWGFYFEGAVGLARFEPGFYEHLLRWPFQNPRYGGLTLAGAGRGCNRSVGWASVDSVGYHDDGAIDWIVMRFEQHCEFGPGYTRGKIRWGDPPDEGELLPNHPPVLTLPDTPLDVLGGEPTLLPGIEVADPDALPSEALAVVVQAPGGTLSAETVPGTTAQPSGSSLVLRGPAEDLNTSLATLRYTSGGVGGRTDQLTVTVDDEGHGLPDRALSDSGTMAVQVARNNHAPQVNAPSTLVPVAVDQPSPVPGVSVSDRDAIPTDVMTVRLSVPIGTLGVTPAAGTAAGGSALALTLRGTLASLNATLATLRYTAPPPAGQSFALQVSVDDEGHGLPSDALTAERTVTLIAAAGNRAPTITVSRLPIRARVGVGKALPRAVVADPDAGTAPVAAAVTVTKGILEPLSLTGVTVTHRTDQDVTFTGPITAVNKVLAAMRWVPTTTGPAELQFSVDDQGNSGPGGARSATASIELQGVRRAGDVRWTWEDLLARFHGGP